MRRSSRHRPSPALIISILALVVAVGGGAFAVAAGGGKKEIIKISSKQDAKNVPGIVQSLAPGLSVSHAHSADNAHSADKVGTVTVQAKTLAAIPSASEDVGTVSCPAGQQALGGGVLNPVTADTAIIDSRPAIGPSGVPANGQTFDSWRSGVRNDSGGSITPTIFVICSG